jgi:hypothetical protein
VESYQIYRKTLEEVGSMAQSFFKNLSSGYYEKLSLEASPELLQMQEIQVKSAKPATNVLNDSEGN